MGEAAVKLAVTELALNVLLLAATYFLRRWLAEKDERTFKSDLKGILPKINTQLKNKETEILYRQSLGSLLGKTGAQSLPHEEIISKLDDAGKMFHILVLKTTMTIPYTSVFIRLDCGYWTDDAEKRLREAMASK